MVPGIACTERDCVAVQSLDDLAAGGPRKVKMKDLLDNLRLFFVDCRLTVFSLQIPIGNFGYYAFIATLVPVPE
jgi:hypothetical protein